MTITVSVREIMMSSGLTIMIKMMIAMMIVMMIAMMIVITSDSVLIILLI
jgi:hypothetical protein